MGHVVAPEVAPGDHACCVFGSDDDQAALVARLARDAFARNDRVFYLADRNDEAAVASMLDDAGLGGRAALATGRLRIRHSSELELGAGFDRQRQLAVWRAMVAEARDDGYRGLSVAAEMTWALSRGIDADALVDYEAHAGAAFADARLSALCQYDRRLFDAPLLERARDAHPCALTVEGADWHATCGQLRLTGGAEARCVGLSGEVDLANLAFLERYLATGPGGTLVLDCAELSFIDLGGSRLLERAIAAGRVELRNVPPVLATVLGLLDEAG